jgi:hypothetical protein
VHTTTYHYTTLLDHPQGIFPTVGIETEEEKRKRERRRMDESISGEIYYLGRDKKESARYVITLLTLDWPLWGDHAKNGILGCPCVLKISYIFPFLRLL